MPTLSPDTDRTIIVGAGSIGIRHRRVLESLGSKVVTVSRRSAAGDFDSLAQAVIASEPTYVVLATETERHLESLEDLAATDYAGRVLLEKPILDRPGLIPELPFESVSIGYHLRFHPAVQALRTALSGHRILSAQLRYGQFLPDWRPGRDYRTTVTAGPGGGVLLELSHELDLVNWLLGPSTAICGLTSNTHTFDMEREDLAVGLLGLADGGIISFELNCLDRVQNRTMKVTTAESLFELDLIAGSLTINGEVITAGPVERDEVFAAMHRAVISGQPDACTIDEAMAVLHMVEDLRSL